ncbi:MAG: HEAT repeat domain-containing protein, partial [Phycisphaerae bacterium]
PARVWMLRQLAHIGGEESVAKLTELLDDEDPRIRELSRRALQNNAAAAAAHALRTALDRAAEPSWQIALINALAARRDEASVSRLAELAQAVDGSVATASIAALGDIGGDMATRSLYAVWRGQGSTRRAAAAGALIRIGQRLAASGVREPAATIFEDTYGSSIPARLRVAALHGMVITRETKTIPLLLELLDGRDPRMAVTAARFLEEIPGYAATRMLIRAFDKASPTAQALLLGVFAARADTIARSTVERAVESEDDAVRVAALRALQHVGSESTIVLLAEVAARSVGEERDAARKSLDLLRGEAVDRRILIAVQSSSRNPAVLCELIRSLAARWYRPAIPALFQASKADQESIRVAAFEALGTLASKSDLPTLALRLVNVSGEEAREAAENAVVKTSLRIDDVEQRAEPVLAVLDDTVGALKASLVRVLGRIRGGRALDAIRAARQVEDADVVDAAVRALASWPDPEVTGDLLDVARTSPSETHRVLALRGYVRLVRLPDEREPVETFQMLEKAMALAGRPEEKKLVLAGLADVRHLNALATAESLLNDQALRAEAAVTMLTIARALAAEERTAALAAIERVHAAPVGEKVQQQVQQASEFIERFRGYSAAWVISGPYQEEGKKSADLFYTAFPPEVPDAPDVEWTPLAVNNHDNPWIFDLSRAIGGVSRCVYAKTSVWSAQEREVRLEIGSDDGVKAWLNGQLVHSNPTYRGLTPGEDQVGVTFREGWNTLVLKIVQGGGPWGFCAGFKSVGGGTLEDLKFKPE